MYVYTYLHKNMYMHTYVYTCAYMCICIYMYIFMYIYIYICTYIHIYIYRSKPWHLPRAWPVCEMYCQLIAPARFLGTCPQYLGAPVKRAIHFIKKGSVFQKSYQHWLSKHAVKERIRSRMISKEPYISSHEHCICVCACVCACARSSLCCKYTHTHTHTC